MSIQSIKKVLTDVESLTNTRQVGLRRSVNRVILSAGARRPRRKKKIVVQCLWVGSELPHLAVLSLKSFLRVGMEPHLYTYKKMKNVVGKDIKQQHIDTHKIYNNGKSSFGEVVAKLIK